jgi:hypothetical protein
MRKKYLYLLMPLVFISCDIKEDEISKSQSITNPTQTYIINGDIEYISEITDGSKPTKAKLVYDIPKNKFKTETTGNITSKVAGQSIINFNYGIGDPTNSGCTVKKYNNGDSYVTDSGVYGYNPARQNDGYLIRGYGVPHHNLYYGSLVLFASNKGRKVTVEGRDPKVYNDNLSTISAISIEYPFKSNVTYEISVRVFFKDNRMLIDKVQSTGFPTLNASLENSGILFGGGPSCQNDLRHSATELNYIKYYTLEDNIIKERTITYKFSPTQVKKALKFNLLPARGARGTNAKIPTNNYTMAVRTVTITEKPFDPSLNITQ